MKNIFHKEVWGVDTNPAHVEPPPIMLVKETTTVKSDGDYVKSQGSIQTEGQMQ